VLRFVILQDACHCSQDGIDCKGDRLHRRRHVMASDTAVPQGTSQWEGTQDINLTTRRVGSAFLFHMPMILPKAISKHVMPFFPLPIQYIFY